MTQLCSRQNLALADVYLCIHVCVSIHLCIQRVSILMFTVIESKLAYLMHSSFIYLSVIRSSFCIEAFYATNSICYEKFGVLPAIFRL